MHEMHQRARVLAWCVEALEGGADSDIWGDREEESFTLFLSVLELDTIVPWEVKVHISLLIQRDVRAVISDLTLRCEKFPWI